MANGTATAQQQPKTDPVKRLYEVIKQTGAINNVPEFEAFKQDAQSLDFQKNIYGALKQTEAVKGLPEFETFQKDFFGKPMPGSPNVAPETPPQEEPAEGSDLMAGIYDQRRDKRIIDWRNRAQKLDEKAARLEDEAMTNLTRIPGARSIPDPELKKQASAARQERNRLLKLAGRGEQTVLDEQDTGQSRASSAASSFVRGLGQTLGEDTLKSAGIIQGLLSKQGHVSFGTGGRGFQVDAEPVDPRETELYKAGQEVGDAIRETFPTNPKFQREFLTTVLPQGAGSMAAFLVGGAASKGLKIGSLGAGVLGGMTIGSNEFDLALEQGADLETAFDTFLLNLPIGATEMIPIARMFRRLDNVTGGGAKRVLRDGFTGGVEEFIQETTQQTLSNATGKALVDQTRDILEGVGEGGAAGFILGALMNGVGRGISNARNKATSAEERQAVRRAEELLAKARQTFTPSPFKPGQDQGSVLEKGTLRNPAEVSFDPEAPPKAQLEQLQNEKTRLETEMERAEAAGESTEDFEAVLDRVDQSIELLNQEIAGAEAQGQQPRRRRTQGLSAQSAQVLNEIDSSAEPDIAAEIRAGRIMEAARAEGIQNVSEKTPSQLTQELRERARTRGVGQQELTQEAEEFLQAAESEGATPAFITNRLRKIAEDNGVEVTPQTTPQEIVEQLQGRRGTTTEEQTEPAEERPKITVFRGEGRGAFPAETNEAFDWVAEDRSVAMDYAGLREDVDEFNVQEREITEPENVFQFPFKTNVDVRASDIGGQLRNEIGRQIDEGNIGERSPRIRQLLDKVAEYEEAAGNELEKWHTKINKPGANTILRDLLSDLGYDAIGITENGVQTYGLFKGGEESASPEVTMAPTEYTTANEQFRVEDAGGELTVTNIETGQEVEQDSPEFASAAGEYFAAETADAGMVNRAQSASDLLNLRNIAQYSNNPVQVATALNEAQELQEGSQDSELQNGLRQRFQELTGVELSPQLAEEIVKAKGAQQTLPSTAGQAQATEDQVSVGQILGDAVGQELTPGQLLGAVDGGRFFGDDTAMRELRSMQQPMSRTTLVYMTPQEFLDMAAPIGAYNPESLNYQKQQIRENKKLDGLLFLRIGKPDGKPALLSENSTGEVRVVGHEGRHRAKALQDAGVERIPVAIQHRTLRWGTRQDRPTVMLGEELEAPESFGSNADNEMAFPQSAIYPTDVDQRNTSPAGRRQKPQLQGLTRGEMGAAVTPGTGGAPLTGAGRRKPNLNEDWVNDPQPLREIIDDLVKSANLTLREGRMTLRQALGQYSMRSGVTRVQVREALEVVAHEAGHDIDDNYAKEIATLTKLHADEIAPLAYPQAAPNQKISEGFAEFFRLYITNPNAAEQAAPNFYVDFRSWMRDLDNNMFGDFERIRGAYQAFLNQPSDAAIEGDVVQSPTRGEEITRKIKEDGLGNIIKNKLGQFYRAAVGEDDILRLARNQLLDIHYENTGNNLDISPLMDFYKLNRISLDAYSAGAMDIEFGVENYFSAKAEGVSLRDALHKAFGKDWSDEKRRSFSAYLISRRAVNEWDRFFDGKIRNRPTKFTRADHKLNIKKQEGANPEFKEAAEMVQEYTRNLWKKLRDSGLISSEVYQNGLDEHPFYVPFFRDMSDQTNVSGEGSGQTGKNTVIKAFQGSDRPILDPVESIMKMTYEYNMLIKANDVKVALLKMAHKAGSGAGAIAEEIPNTQAQGIPVDTRQVVKKLSEATDWTALGARDAMGQLLQVTSLDNIDLPDLTFFKQGEINEKGEPIVFAWINGKRRAIRLADQEFGMEMYNVLTNQHSAAAEMTVNALSYPASWLRTGVTTEPSFFIANLIRDQVSAWILTDVGFKPFGSIVKDLTDRGKQTAAEAIEGFEPQVPQTEGIDKETQQEYSRLYRTFSGISTFNVAALDENRAKQEVKKLKTKNIPLRRLESVRGLNELLDLSEIGTRLGVFQRAMQRAKERGLSQKEAAVEAGFMARDLIDFGRHGSKLSATRRLLPFFNAAIQGLDKGVRVLSGEGNLWRAITPYIKDVNGRPLNEEEQSQVRLAQKAWLKTMEIGMIGATMTALYWDDPEYDEIPDYLKHTHWIFKNPVMTEEASSTGLGEWIAVPKPFELAFISNTMESLISSYANQDPEWKQEWMKSIYEIVTPPISPTGIQVPGEVWANKRKFDGRPIVYDRLLGREPWQQYNSYTSGFGKWMGKQINVSPAIIDHVVMGTTGSWGRVLLQATTQTAPGAPSGGWEDTWIARRFVRSADRGNKSSKQFWGQVAPQEGELTSTMGSFRFFFESGTPDEAFEYFEKQEPYEKLYIAMQYVDKDNKDVLPILDQPHPLDNARKTSSIISNMRTDLIESQGVFENVGSDDKRSMDDLLDRLATVEYRNALISSRHPKWVEREPMDFNKVLNTIRSEFPILHQEMVARYNESKQPMNPQSLYDRFQQYAATPNLTDKLLPIVQLQRQQLEQQLNR